MRKIIFSFLTALLMFNLTGCSIRTMPTTPTVKVIHIDKEKQDKLYVKASNWMVETFNNSKSVIQFRDKESGTITGRYLLGIIAYASQYGPAQYAYAIIKIQVKDGASKITIKPEPFRYVEGIAYYTQEKAEADIKLLTESFQTYMQKTVNEKW